MGTVTINSVTYTIYGTLAGAEERLDAVLHATNWAAATTTNKSKALYTATQFLERQTWAGEPTADGQALAWPRTGVTDRYGNEVDDATIPADVIAACYELAEILLGDATASQEATSAADNIKRIKAGSVEVEKWKPVAGGRFPTIVQELVGQYLAGSTASIGIPVLNGSDSDASSFDADDFFDLTEGL